MRLTGAYEGELPEWMFDLELPASPQGDVELMTQKEVLDFNPAP